MTDKQKQWIAYAIVVVAILVAGFLGVTYPIPAPPVATVGSQSFNYPPGAIYFAEGGKNQVFQSGSTATFQSGSHLVGDAGSDFVFNTLTVTNLISQTLGFDATGSSTFVTATISGPAALNGGLTMDTNKFTVADGSGNTSVGGTLAVAGVSTFSGFDIYSSASITPTDGGILTPTAFLVTLTPAGVLGTEMGACTSGQKTILYNSIASNVVITDTANGVLAGNQTLGQYDTLQLVCVGAKWVQVGAVSAN